jgi:hypothetical protein
MRFLCLPPPNPINKAEGRGKAFFFHFRPRKSPPSSLLTQLIWSRKSRTINNNKKSALSAKRRKSISFLFSFLFWQGKEKMGPIRMDKVKSREFHTTESLSMKSEETSFSASKKAHDALFM